MSVKVKVCFWHFFTLQVVRLWSIPLMQKLRLLLVLYTAAKPCLWVPAHVIMHFCIISTFKAQRILMLCVCVCMCVSFRALLPAWWWSLQTQIRNGPFDACSRWPVRWASSIRWPCSLERTVPMPRQELSLFLSLITHYSQQNCSVSVEKSVDSKVLIIHSAPCIMW